MVRIIHIFFLFLFPMSVWAQETEIVFKGAVTDTNGKGIANVLCKVLNAKDSLLAYSISRSDGGYTLKYKKQATKLSFAKMGFATQCIPVEKDKLRYDVQLIEKSYAIDEVVVKADPITRKKDTLNYHVESFRQKEDYSIEDVLKHMPGIKVLPSGQIMYQGNSINKVNIEGLDLMGDQYNQATQNMPAEAVSTIRVMENNQPIRALEGKVHSNRATLNIKLKKNYRMRPFGDAEVGVGGTPVVWDGSLTGIQVNKKNQLLFTGALNNRGASLRSLQSGMSNFTGIYIQEPLPAPFLYSATNRRPPISPLYYLDNRSYFAGVNYLHAFTPYSTLRFNLLYNHEGENREDSTRNEYYAADTVSVRQQPAAYVRRRGERTGALRTERPEGVCREYPVGTMASYRFLQPQRNQRRFGDGRHASQTLLSPECGQRQPDDPGPYLHPGLHCAHLSDPRTPCRRLDSR